MVKPEPKTEPKAEPGVDKSELEHAQGALMAAQKEAAQARTTHAASAAALQQADTKVAAAQAAVSAAGVVKLKAPDGMIATTAGLPNSCSVCGEPIEGGVWYAVNEDAARAGGGMDLEHAQKFSDAQKSMKQG